MQARSWKGLRAVLAKHCCVTSTWELACVCVAWDMDRTSLDLSVRGCIRSCINADTFSMFAIEGVIKRCYLELTSVVTTASIKLIHFK